MLLFVSEIWVYYTWFFIHISYHEDKDLEVPLGTYEN